MLVKCAEEKKYKSTGNTLPIGSGFLKIGKYSVGLLFWFSLGTMLTLIHPSPSTLKLVSNLATVDLTLKLKMKTPTMDQSPLPNYSPKSW
jgi:hypothetical protein